MSATATIAPPRVADRKMLIDGKWVDSASGKTFETINPATGDTICRVAEGDAADVDLAVKAARRAFESKPWARMSASQRGRLIYKLADLMEAHAEDLAALETLDNGKPIRDSLNVDIPTAIACYRYYAGWADKIHGKTIPVNGPYLAHTRHEPVGVVGQIIPWNFPVLMQSWKWAPALAAGSTVILKPAEHTPPTALRVPGHTPRSAHPQRPRAGSPRSVDHRRGRPHGRRQNDRRPPSARGTHRAARHIRTRRRGAGRLLRTSDRDRRRWRRHWT